MRHFLLFTIVKGTKLLKTCFDCLIGGNGKLKMQLRWVLYMSAFFTISLL